MDLKELMRVLYTLDADVGLAVARDAAIDAFVLLHVDAAKCTLALSAILTI